MQFTGVWSGKRAEGEYRWKYGCHPETYQLLRPDQCGAFQLKLIPYAMESTF